MAQDDAGNLAGKRTIKRFRVAREGQTVDGRTLSQQEILDMAETYDPVEYTARINVEHMSGWGGLNSSYAPALGDVIAVDAQLETFTINNQSVQLMCLYATLSALPALVEANKNGQKLFTSIEFYRKFADTDRAYLVGLAVTDIPASRGTQPLKFSAQQNTIATLPTQELELMTTQNQSQTDGQSPTQADATHVPATTPSAEPDKQTANDKGDADTGFLQKLSGLFNKSNKGMTEAEQDAVFEGFKNLNQTQTDLQKKYDDLEHKHDQLSKDFHTLHTKLANQTTETIVPDATGNGAQLAEY